MNTPEQHTQPAVVVYVSLGSNIEPRAESMTRALDKIAQLPGLSQLNKSTVYETAPVEMSDSSGLFLNQVVRFETTLEPVDLLVKLQSIEQQLGRIEKGSYRARTIDLDLLLYGDRVLQDEQLVLPHPRMTERLFVLEPLLELEPELVDPASGLTYKTFYDQLISNAHSTHSPNSHVTERA